MNENNRLFAREQEQSVLGGLLLDNDAIDRIGDLRAEHFADSLHRAIFKAILQLILANKQADVITVWEQLQTNGADADLPYLNALMQSTPSAANIRRYAETVRDRAIKRGLISLCRETSDVIETSPDDSAALVDRLSSRLDELARTTVKSEPELASDSLVQHIEIMDAICNGTVPLAISTGFPDLDKKLGGGLHRGGLYVLAGRPKMGKSALAFGIGNNIALNGGIVGALSMEMPKKQLHERNLASIGKIPLDHVTDPRQMLDAEWANLTAATEKIMQMKLYVDVQPGLSLMQVRTKAKQIKRKAKGLDALVIDYLQLMSGEGDNRNAQIEGITRGLKCLAKELDIPIILLSQLNRELERRPNKRPMPSDLRDSGSIEQDADVAIFLYRDEVYNPDSSDKGICEVDVALNRQGAPGRVALAYIGEQTRFESLKHTWHPPVPKSAPIRSRGFSDGDD
jgi:replicative DNA helicase